MKTASFLEPTSLAPISLATVFSLAFCLLSSVAAAQAIREIQLPAELSYPEGIGYDAASGHIYTASALDGIVVRTNLRSGASEIIAKPGVILPDDNKVFPGALGMKVDRAKRLWLTGGRTGKIHVLDTRDGSLIKTIATPGEGGVLNDTVVTQDYVYVTDTFRPTLWRVPVNGSQIGEAEAWIDLKGSPIDYSQQGPKLNGVTLTPDGKDLIVVHMGNGKLFKIGIATRAITPIDIGTDTVQGGDGLALDGTLLYVVRQPAAEVVTVKLASDLSSGKIVSRLTDPAIKWPATAVKVGDELLVVNAQFNKRATNDPVRPFSVTAIPVSRLGGNEAALRK
ncbi:MAG TPA: hypothetical protein VJS47_10860 [Rhizomicrobium sp.]|nr:hypothetical protein [Rhizomicrobium sp.]